MKKILLLIVIAASAGFSYRALRQGVAEEPASRFSDGRVYLTNGNFFDGSISLSPDEGVRVISGSSILKFSVEDVREVRFSSGIRLSPSSLAELEKTYSDRLPPQERYDHLIKRFALKSGLDERLVREVIRQESGFNYMAVSHKGASGLMQLMPLTAARYGVENIFDPVENIRAGTEHLAHLLKLYGGDIKLALAAYNAGTSAVARYDGIPPFRETRSYVRVVYGNYREHGG